MSIADRIKDAEMLWNHHRREGALLSVLIATAATARRSFPEIKGDRESFEKFLASTHNWKIAVEHRGQPVDIDQLIDKWLRCELVHSAGLPFDLRIDDSFSDPTACSVRAGGAPHHTVLLSPGWYYFLVAAVRDARVNADMQWTTASPRPSA